MQKKIIFFSGRLPTPLIISSQSVQRLTSFMRDFSNFLNTWAHYPSTDFLSHLLTIYCPSQIMIFSVTLKFLIISMILAGRVVTAMAPPTFQIHPNGNKNKCLDVRGAVFENNTPVDMSAIFSLSLFLRDNNVFFRYDCNGTRAQDWWIFNGSTKVRLAGTNFCLDAGTCRWLAF